MEKENYAIIDIGSNTIRLVIFQKHANGRIKEIQNIKISARLRAYLTEDSILTSEGVDRLIYALKSFEEVTSQHQLKEVICVATATVRQAKNQEAILELVSKETPFTIRVLSGYEEAYFGYYAIINSMPIKDGISIDFGGGSTELTYFKDRNLEAFHSFPFGAVSLKQQFIKGEIPTSEELVHLKNFLIQEFETLPWLKDLKLPIIMIGGSARNLVQIDQVQKNYPLTSLHQYRMTQEEIKLIKQELTGLSAKELVKVDGLSNDRLDTIVPAIEVFDSLSDYSKAPQFILSRKGLREGVLYAKVDQEKSKANQVIEHSLHELAMDYEINVELGSQVLKTVLKLIKEFKKGGFLDLNLTKKDEDLVKKATLVFDLGKYIDTDSSSQHTFYLLANRTIEGFFHKEKIKLALMASYKNKQMFKRYYAPFKHWYTKMEKRKMRVLGAFIKLGYSLHTTERSIIDRISIEEKNEKLHFKIACHQNWEPEKHQFLKDKKHLEKLMKRPITVEFIEATRVN